MRKSFFTYILMFFISNVNASELTGAACLEKAQTQSEMNRCANINFKIADAELNRVYKKIKVIYKEDKEFLKKLRLAQLAWIKSRDADMDMIYPLEHNNHNYGSSFSMCYSGFKEILTIARIEYLKRWTRGHGDGELCSGSIMHSFYIEEQMNKK